MMRIKTKKQEEAYWARLQKEAKPQEPLTDEQMAQAEGQIKSEKLRIAFSLPKRGPRERNFTGDK